MPPLEFDDAEHYGFFLSGTSLTSETGHYVRMSALVLSALRAAGVFSTMEDGTTAPATNKLWLDKNTDPPTLKEWDATGSSWVPMTYGRLFGRAAVDNLTVTGGTGNAVVVSAPTGFQGNRLYLITPTNTNSGATTIQVSGVGTYNVKYGDGSDISASEFTSGRQSVLFFTGARFEVVFSVSGLNSAVTAAAASASAAAGSASAAATSASNAATSASNAASAATGILTGASSDNTFADTDEVIYLTGTTVKRGTLTGLISSIFATARTIANARFEASSFSLMFGSFRRINSGTLTADRTDNWPDGNITFQAGTLATTADVQSWTNISVALAALTANSVGSLTFARRTTGTAEVPNGSTIAGSSLTPAGGATVDAATLSGTWRCLGYVGSGVTASNSGTLYVRIS